MLRSWSEEFIISTFLVITDSLILNLDKRIKTYSKVDKPRSFLWHCDVADDISLKGVIDFYVGDSDDLSQVENEWFLWRSLINYLNITFSLPPEMLKLMFQNNFSTFPHLRSSSSLRDNASFELCR